MSHKQILIRVGISNKNCLEPPPPPPSWGKFLKEPNSSPLQLFNTVDTTDLRRLQDTQCEVRGDTNNNCELGADDVTYWSLNVGTRLLE